MAVIDPEKYSTEDMKGDIMKGVTEALVSDLEKSVTTRTQKKKIIDLKTKILNDVIKNLEEVKIDKIESAIDLKDIVNFKDADTKRNQVKQIQKIRNKILDRLNAFVDSPELFKFDPKEQQIKASDIIDFKEFKSNKVRNSVLKLQTKLIERITKSFDDINIEGTVPTAEDITGVKGANKTEQPTKIIKKNKTKDSKAETDAYFNKGNNDASVKILTSINTKFSNVIDILKGRDVTDKTSSDELKKSIDTMSKESGKGITKMLGAIGPVLKAVGPIAAVAAAGIAGFKLGEWIDKKFKISEKIGKAAGDKKETSLSKKNLKDNEKSYLSGDLDKSGKMTPQKAEIGKSIKDEFIKNGGMDEKDPVKRSQLLDEAQQKGIKNYTASKKGTSPSEIKPISNSPDTSDLDSEIKKSQDFKTQLQKEGRDTSRIDERIKTLETQKKIRTSQSESKPSPTETKPITDFTKNLPKQQTAAEQYKNDVAQAAAPQSIDLNTTNNLLKELVDKTKQNKSIIIQPRDNSSTIMTEKGEF